MALDGEEEPFAALVGLGWDLVTKVADDASRAANSWFDVPEVMFGVGLLFPGGALGVRTRVVVVLVVEVVGVGLRREAHIILLIKITYAYFLALRGAGTRVRRS